MKFEFLALAEDSAEDGRGALALVGLNQNLIIARSLPAHFRRVVVAYVGEEDGETPLPADTPVSIAVRMESPSGKVVVAGGGQSALGPKPVPELPGAVQFAIELAGTTTEFGAHTVTCEVTIAGAAVSASRRLYILPVPQARTEPSSISAP